MRLFLAILLGKLIILLTRTFKIGGGSAAPGLYGLKIDPDLVTKLASKIPKNIVITGTNGKTTTARILAHLAKEAGLKVIRNHTGSNLERGIASALILQSSILNLKSPFDLGIWELDEAAFNSVAPKLNPDLVLFLNVSRDQLDRYGEIDKVVSRWCETIKKFSPKTVVLISPELVKLKNFFKVKEFEIPKNIKTNGLQGSEFEIDSTKINLPIPGQYNIDNASAAITAAKYLNIPIVSLDKFSSAFGRVEKLDLPRLAPNGSLDKTGKAGFGYIFLIKNPKGATQVLETIAPILKKEDRLLIALNDNLADGTDISWIWDAEFESLRTINHEPITISSGTRAADMALRLKYAGFSPKQLQVEPSLKKALQGSRIGLKGSLYILPTYTALLELQGLLTKQGLKKHYWSEK